MRRTVALAVILTFIGSMLTGCFPEKNVVHQAPKPAEKIKIGAVFPLSGEVATFGQSSRNAIELAVEEWNQKGGIDGKKIAMLFKDDQNKPTDAANGIQELIEENKVSAVIGSSSSRCSIAMGAIATANKVPMIAPTSTSPKVTVEGGEYVYRACYLDLFQGTVLAKFATDNLKAKKAAILFDLNDDYSKGLTEFFQQGFEDLGGEIVAFESYETGDKDFSKQLAILEAEKPDVILLADYYNSVGVIAKQARETGISATFLGGDGWDSPELLKEGDTSLEGSYFSNHYTAQENSDKGTAFREKYEAKYHNTPDSFAALAYDASYLLFSAIDKADSTDGVKIKDALNTIDIEGVSGRITFDDSRNPIKGAVIEQILGNKTTFITRVNP